MMLRRSVGVLLVFLLALSLFGGSAAALRDNVNIAMKPNSLRCLRITVPDDFNDVSQKVAFTITSDCAWCSLSEARVTTDPWNPVTVPQCISTYGRNVGESISFELGISTTLGTKKFRYGVCVSNSEDVDVGEGDPCDVTSENQDVFAVGIEPARAYTRPNGNVSFLLYVQSNDAQTIELSTSMGQSRTVATTANEPLRIQMSVTAPAEEGEHEFRVDAVVAGCELPSCTKSASAVIVVGEPKPEPPRNFSIFLFPENYNAESLAPITYTLKIRNHGPEGVFSAGLKLPAGLETNFRPQTMTIREKDEIQFTVNPSRASDFYEITAEVQSNGMKKTATAHLSINEFLSDATRLSSSRELTVDASSVISEWKLNYGKMSNEDKMNSYASILQQTKNLPKKNVTAGPGAAPGQVIKPPEPQGINPLIIAVPVAVVVALLLLWFYRRRSVEEEPGGYYE